MRRMETIYFSEYEGRSFYSNEEARHTMIVEKRVTMCPFLQQYQRIFPHKNTGALFLGDKFGVSSILHDNAFLQCWSDDTSEFFTINCDYNKSKNVRPWSEHGNEPIDYLHIQRGKHAFFALHDHEMILRRDKPLVSIYKYNGGYGKSDDENFGFRVLDYMEDYLRHFGYILYGANETVRSYYCPNESLSIVPRHLYCFWTGENTMSDSRYGAFQDLLFHSRANVKLVSVQNLEWYILPAVPLHRAYSYLSLTHKADYLRTYMMHFYGGGYSDIKRPGGSWEGAFRDMLENENMMVNGYKEVGPSGLAHTCLAFDWEKNIGNGAYICRPHSALTHFWYNSMIRFLDEVYDDLVAHPAAGPQDCKEHGGGYPIEWNQMLGRIFHVCAYNYRNFLGQSVPVPDFHGYR